jgi:hypothetical protein
MSPTPAQIEAGNYRKQHRRFAGLDITVESPADYHCGRGRGQNYNHEDLMLMHETYTGPDRRRHPDLPSQASGLRLALTCCIGVVLLLGAVVASLTHDIYRRVEQVEHTLIEHDQSQVLCKK